MKKIKSKTVRKISKCIDCNDKVKHLSTNHFPRCKHCQSIKDGRKDVVNKIYAINKIIMNLSIMMDDLIKKNPTVLL